MPGNPHTFLDFFRSLRDRGLEAFGLYYSQYPGIVVDNEDPKRMGRLRIQCEAVYGKEVPEWWAQPSGFAAVGVNSGFFDVPDKGDPVWITFKMGRPRYPLWGPGWFGKNEVPVTARRDKPTVKVWKMKNGARLEFDTTPGEEHVLLIDSSGSYVKWDSINSDVLVLGQRDLRVRAKSNREVAVGEKDKLFVMGDKETVVYGKDDETIGGRKSETVVGTKMETVQGKKIVSVAGGITEANMGDRLVLDVRGRKEAISMGWLVVVTGGGIQFIADTMTFVTPLATFTGEVIADNFTEV